ncbi:peptidase domain-containing ABC transporter [Thalassotalea sediminis]|uniref:peptidase domain-containing ABC transporter n=1 Tax=Thalassotalea sediminis TaxID=1759089 RepID=UPI002572A21F|nr:peptidase domain-containing ABC transporter [Thalassotalea sediminis]
MEITANSPALLEFSSKKRVPLILQAEVAECGLASMAMIASYYGHQLDMPAMRNRFSATLKGMNLQHLIELGDSLGLASRPLQCPLESVVKLALPCILHWDMNHFVVLTKVAGHKYYINDPASGKQVYTLDEFSQHYTGIALELSPTSKFEVRKEQQKMRISQLWSNITGLKTALVKLLILSFFLQLFSLATPYYMQWVVDEVLVSYDEALLVVLALGFSILVMVSVITNSVRSWLILRLSSLLNIQMGVNVLRHLLRLPMTYFETRHVGDIVSRFSSLNHIRERMTTGLVETTVDGVMSVVVLLMMFLYSIHLTLIVIGTIALYACLRIGMYQPLHRATEDSIQNSAKEQSNFLENIRGIQTIKLFGNEAQRQGIWQNRYAEVINADIHLGKLKIGFDSINKALFGLENVLVIFFAATAVMGNEISIGMVLAFIAYKNQLTQSVTNLIEQLIQFKMMRLHLDRLADIALTKVEQNRDTLNANFKLLNEGSGQLTLENISFSFSEDEKPILDNISFNVEAGDCIAITGPSGSGKSTLVKIMLGLLQPTTGRVLFNGKDIKQIGLKQYRKLVSAVMQDDTLLAGSIADNISFFDPEPNFLKIQQCTKTAAIHKDITEMTMGYNTLVGDMGSSLSGGQQQRVLLARALYKTPRILFLDEATSHLDTQNEFKICEKIDELSMTRIIIAHRPETIRHSNKVLLLNKGKLADISEKQLHSC